MALKSTIENQLQDVERLSINHSVDQWSKWFLDADVCLAFLDTGVYTDNFGFILVFLLPAITSFD